MVTTKTKENKKLKFNLKIFNIFIFVLVLVSGVYYLVGINDLTIKGFKLQELKKEVSQLNDKNKELEIKVTYLESYNNLNERAQELKMVAVGEIDYITSVVEIVAKR